MQKGIELNIVQTFTGKNAMITGGLGFIGSNLAKELIELGATVTLVDSLIPEYGGNLFNIESIKNNARINISDVRDQHSMKYLIKDQDYLFNLAGQTSHMDSMNAPFDDLEINVKAQLSILEACRQYNPNIKILFASTRQIYGKPDYLPVDEKHIIRPMDVNGINKMAGEWYHILYNNVYDIKSCALRLTNTYGPRMRIKDARQTFLGVWMRNLIECKPIEVWGGQQLRDFNYVDDVVDALLIAAHDDKEASGHVFNLGSKEVINLIDLANLMISNYGEGTLEIKEYPENRKKIDIGDYYSNYSLIQERLGWKPTTPLKIGLEKTISFYKKHFEEYL